MRIWFVDAFAGQVFEGNTAAVVPLEAWLPDGLMQAIAAENRCAETAFFIPTGLKGNYQLRWFTPETEVPICGHATLAAGAVLLTEIAPDLDMAVFDTLSGPLVTRKTKDGYTLDLPRKPRSAWDAPAELAAALGGVNFTDAFVAGYATVVLPSEKAVRDLMPDFAAIERLVRGPRAGCAQPGHRRTALRGHEVLAGRGTPATPTRIEVRFRSGERPALQDADRGHAVRLQWQRARESLEVHATRSFGPGSQRTFPAHGSDGRTLRQSHRRRQFHGCWL